MSIFTITSGTKKLVGILLGVSIVAIITTWLYYNNINTSEDPRIIKAKEMLANIDKLMAEKEYNKILNQLDTIEDIFINIPGYNTSFEVGVIYNNRGSVFLSEALYSTNDSILKAKLLDTAEKNIDKAIKIYENWIEKYKPRTKKEIAKEVSSYINKDIKELNGHNIEKIQNRRIEDIELSKIETPRRLSVCYTNKGIIKRHQYKQEEALKYYEKALLLWKDNFTARNNLNTLLGRPIEDRSIIDKLFPKDRKKPDNNEQ